MERKILHISSCREEAVKQLSEMIRNLGRRCQSALWGRMFNPEEDVKSLLYLDSGGRGNLGMMAKSMAADTIEFLFIPEETKKPCILISELFIRECDNGEFFYKSYKTGNKTLGNRIKVLDSFKEGISFFAINETPFERTGNYVQKISEANRNVINGDFREGSIKRLFSEELPDVIICDAFTKNGALTILERTLGKPKVIHIMNGEREIYAPCSVIDREIFIETEDFVKEAFTAICLWLSDNGEERSRDLLFDTFNSLKRGEELILRTEQRFMSFRRRQRRKNNEH